MSCIRLELTQQVLLVKHQELATEMQLLKRQIETSKYEVVAKPVSIEAGSLIADKQYRAGVLTGYVGSNPTHFCDRC